jgi:hypothetical protein
MFVVSEAEAAAIRTAFDQGGEFAAAVELRRLFPGVTDNTQARECARTIAGWQPLPVKPRLGRLPAGQSRAAVAAAPPSDTIDSATTEQPAADDAPLVFVRSQRRL